MEVFIFPKYFESYNIEDITMILEYQEIIKSIVLIGSLSFTIVQLILIINILKTTPLIDYINKISK